MHTIKQKIFQTAIKVENISDDVGSNSGILKILSEIWHLMQKDCAPIFWCIGKRQVHKT